MGVAFGTSDVARSHDEVTARGVDAGDIRHLTRNFEHPEGWTQPSFELFAPAADDIEGLMHVVVLQHLTPELVRRPDFLVHANGCLGVNEITGTIHDATRCAAKMRRLLGDDAVAQHEGGVEIVVPSGQRISLSLSDAQRLESMTLRVSDLGAATTVLEDNGVAYIRPAEGLIRIGADDACGASLQFTDSPPG